MEAGYKVKTSSEIMNLFSGLFFGSYSELIKLQKATLKNIDEDKWNRIRGDIKDCEVNLLKARERERFGLELEKKELEIIERCVSLSRTPPPYQEALKIVRRRAEKIKEREEKREREREAKPKSIFEKIRSKIKK